MNNKVDNRPYDAQVPISNPANYEEGLQLEFSPIRNEPN